MSLGVKQMTPDPWADIDKHYPLGSDHKVKVRNFTNFGIFVELVEGVDGLIHISDLSWTKKIKHPTEFTKVDAFLDVKVLDIDKENRKISLGHKQLTTNPWDEYEEKFGINSVITAEVIDIYDRGALVDLGNAVEGFVPKRYSEKEDGSYIVKGEKLDFKVIEFSKENKKILLSHSATYNDELKKEIEKKKKTTQKVIKKIQQDQKQSTLGDLDELSSLKNDLENQ